LNVSGALWKTWAGPMLYAIGGQQRTETLDYKELVSSTVFSNHRDVTAGFLELRIPLIGANGGASSATGLELTLADRNERYSDFGSTNNPKIGMAWRPAPDIKVRGTYGTSFRAPLLIDLNPTSDQVIPVPLFDPLKGGSCDFLHPTNSCTNTLFVFGGNAQLKPEKAKTWTLGLDLSPANVPGLKANVTYYDIRYRDRIVNPQDAASLFDFLRNEQILGPRVIQRNPSTSLVQQLIASTTHFANFLNVDLSDLSTIGAIADSRLQNLASVRTRGIDFGVSYKVTIPFGAMEAGLDGTKILKLTKRFSSTSLPTEDLDTPGAPVSLKLRARGIVKHEDLTFALFINYVNSYKDNQGGSSASVSSWTTADTTLSYQFGRGDARLRDFLVTVGVTNITNRTPPYVVDLGGNGVNFDPANANPMGRFVYVQISKRF